MKPPIFLSVLLVFNTAIFGQTDMDSQCLKAISQRSKDIVFPKIEGPINVKGDTIQFDRSLIFLQSSSLEAFLIFRKGLLYPSLILGASTNGDGQFEISSIPFIGTLSIGSFHQLTALDKSPTTKTFSFLRWQQGFANPQLYILQLTNDKADSDTKPQEFIEGARLSAFGFCSILI